ncbi:membrane hypothetical protein [Candidatus Magnetomoraceae bacterium gMMP-15]
MEDYYEHGWLIFTGMLLLYSLVILFIPEHSGDYENVNNIEPIIKEIHYVLITYRHSLNFLLSFLLSPWIITRQINLEKSLHKSEEVDFFNWLFIFYYVVVVFFGQIIVYNFFAPIVNIILEYLLLVIVIPLLFLTFLSIVFKNEEEEYDFVVAASIAFLTIIIVIFLAFTHDFSVVWAFFTWLSITPISIFLPILCLIPFRVIKVDMQDYFIWIGITISAIIIAGFLYWATINEYSITWLLFIISKIVGVLLFILIFLGARNISDVQEFINEHLLKNIALVNLPRIQLKKIERSYADSGSIMVNVIIDSSIIIFVTLLNIIVKTCCFVVNSIIVNFIEVFLKTFCWIFLYIYNILLFIFSYLVFIIRSLPEFLYDVILCIYKSIKTTIRRVYLPIIALTAFVISINFSLQFAIDYFLINQKYLLIGIVSGIGVNIISIIFAISLLFDTLFYIAFNKVFEFYVKNFCEILAYFILLICCLCWFLVWFAPQWGIYSFTAGVVTWTLTIIVCICIIIAICYRKFRRKNVCSQTA